MKPFPLRLLVCLVATGSTAMVFSPCRSLASDKAPLAGAVRGVYALSNKTQPLADWVINRPDIDGISLRASWSDVQRLEDEPVWLFDAQIARAVRAGKKVILCVWSGFRTPDWVYQAGAQPFTYVESIRFQATHDETQRIPIPWDAVFLSKWTGFIKMLGRKYNGNSAVALVHLAGPAHLGPEMHLPDKPADRRHWAEVGYTPAKLVHAWKVIIDAYAEAFPNKLLAINVSQPIYYNDRVVENVLAYAHAKLGLRLALQQDALSAKVRAEFRPHQWVCSYRGKALLGFQLLCPVTPRGKFNDEGRRLGGTLGEAFDIGLKAGGSYFEIYPIDLKEAAAAKDIHDLALALRKQR